MHFEFVPEFVLSIRVEKPLLSGWAWLKVTVSPSSVPDSFRERALTGQVVWLLPSRRATDKTDMASKGHVRVLRNEQWELPWGYNQPVHPHCPFRARLFRLHRLVLWFLSLRPPRLCYHHLPFSSLYQLTDLKNITLMEFRASKKASKQNE